jgi:hypothetical protein
VQQRAAVENYPMRSTMRPSRLRGCSIWCALAIALACGAPAFAGVDSLSQSARYSARTQPQAIQTQVHKKCYVRVGWGIPQLCDRFTGPYPTTANPMEIIGRAY